MQTHIFDKNINNIANHVKSNLSCYNTRIEKKVKTVGYSASGYGKSATQTTQKDTIKHSYLCSINKVEAGYELTLQRDGDSSYIVKQKNSWPEGGMYMLAINYEAVSKKKTKLTIYQMPKPWDMNFWDELINPIVKWSKVEKLIALIFMAEQRDCNTLA